MTPEAGLTEQQVVAARSRGEGNSVGDASSRSYLLIIRTNLFNFFNNILFTIGVALLALGRVNDAILSVGLGLLNAVISSGQELRAKRKLDGLRLLHSGQALVLRDGGERHVPARDLVRGDLLRLGAGDQVAVDGPLVGGPAGSRRVPADRRIGFGVQAGRGSAYVGKFLPEWRGVTTR